MAMFYLRNILQFFSPDVHAHTLRRMCTFMFSELANAMYVCMCVWMFVHIRIHIVHICAVLGLNGFCHFHCINGWLCDGHTSQLKL